MRQGCWDWGGGGNPRHRVAHNQVLAHHQGRPQRAGQTQVGQAKGKAGVEDTQREGIPCRDGTVREVVCHLAQSSAALPSGR